MDPAQLVAVEAVGQETSPRFAQKMKTFNLIDGVLRSLEGCYQSHDLDLLFGNGNNQGSFPELSTPDPYGSWRDSELRSCSGNGLGSPGLSGFTSGNGCGWCHYHIFDSFVINT